MNAPLTNLHFKECQNDICMGHALKRRRALRQRFACAGTTCMVLIDGLYDIATFGAQRGNGFGGGCTRLLLLERTGRHAITRS